MRSELKKRYDEFISRWKVMTSIEQSALLLEWDQETMMPPSGAAHRATQIEALMDAHQRMLRDDRLYRDLQYLKRAAAKGLIRGAEARNVHLAYRTAGDARKIPAKLEGELRHLGTLGYEALTAGHNSGDYAKLIPIIEQIVAKKRSFARHLSGGSGDLYTPILQIYEPDLTTKQIERLFEEIKEACLEIAERLRPHLPRVKTDFFEQSYGAKRLDTFTRRIMHDMGFDFSRGRLDKAPHHSCCGLPTDARLVVNYDDGLDAIWQNIHEAGHGIALQSFNTEEIGMPIGEEIGMSVEESISQFWEVFIGKSRAFWKYYFPKLKRLFPSQLRGVGFEGFYCGVNAVRQPFDFLTFCFDIIVSFEMERDLIAGDLQVKDIPHEWNTRTWAFLGMEPQDPSTIWRSQSHWATGMFGYHPAYLVSLMIDAQLYDTLQSATPTLDERLETGDLSSIREWLHEHFYRYGARYPLKTLVRRATGKSLNPKYLIRYMKALYSDVYDMDF